MCGIFGMVLDPGTALAREAIEYDIRLLFKLTEPRGMQATGIAIFRDREISTLTRPQSASKVIRRPLFSRFLEHALYQSPGPASGSRGATAFLGHCRLVTNGTELKPGNNHPVCVGSVVGVHNGVINNSRKIAHSRGIEQGESDAQILFGLLSDSLADAEPSAAVQRTYGQISGSAAIAFFTTRFPQLAIATNFGSIFYASSRRDGFFVFGSERLILQRYLRRGRLPRASRSEAVHKLEPRTGAIVPFSRPEPRVFSIDGAAPANPSTPARIPTPFTIRNCNPSPDNLRRCKRCILPASYPLLTFDSEGVCSHCRKYKKQKPYGREALERVLSKYRSKDGRPDCLIGLSGGRDSSFALHLIKKEFGMHPVAFTFDWLLTSQKARHNVAKMTGALGVEVIYRTSDYERQAENIRKNIYAWLHKPELGMMPFVQAGDKPMYHYGRKIRKELDVALTVWGSGYQMEGREFFMGYAGIDKTLHNNPRPFDYRLWTKLRLALYYGYQTLRNPRWINRSLVDNLINYYHYFAKEDFLYLYRYYPWNEGEMERVLHEQYGWEADAEYGPNQWRMDDFHTPFINYVYYTVGGFSEFDDFRAHQVRQGLITRDEALRLARQDNKARLGSLRSFSGLVGFNLEHVLKKIDAIPKLY